MIQYMVWWLKNCKMIRDSFFESQTNHLWFEMIRDSDLIRLNHFRIMWFVFDSKNESKQWNDSEMIRIRWFESISMKTNQIRIKNDSNHMIRIINKKRINFESYQEKTNQIRIISTKKYESSTKRIFSESRIKFGSLKKTNHQ